MASFDKYTNFNETAGVSGVVFGADKPVLEVEMNEMQEVQKSRLNRAMRRLFGNGITDKKKITFDGSKVNIASDCALLVDGYVVECTGLSVAMTSGTAYLQVWEETVDYSATLKKEGNEQSSTTVPNYFKDSRSPQETTKRKVVKYTLATSTNSARHNLAVASVSNGILTVLCKELNVNKLTDQVIDLREQQGTIGEGVMGIHVDLENNTCVRIGDNENWTGGSDYDQSPVYGGRYRCNVTDAGVIVAKWGDEAYTETGALTKAVVGSDDVTYPVGTKVQCMVYQPLFFYKRIPLRVKKQVNSTYTVKGFHLLEFIDLISPVMRDGFKVHPAFKKGDTVLDGYFVGENDGCLESASGAYDMNDNTVSIGSSPYTGIKFSSIAGAKPASGSSKAGISKDNALTRDAIRKMCANRGADWQQEDVTIASAEEMLFVVEYATFNIQNCATFGAGVTGLPWVDNTNDSVPCPTNTALGNGSGTIEVKYTHSNGTQYTVKVPVYRGVKNPYGNIWKFIDGFLRKNTALADANEFFYQDGSKAFSDAVEDYIASGFSCATQEGYIKAFGYSEDCDWCYIPSMVGGDSNRPVGDYYYVNMGLNTYIARLGASWNDDSRSGVFYWGLNSVASSRYCNFGGRLCRKSTVTKVVC